MNFNENVKILHQTSKGGKADGLLELRSESQKRRPGEKQHLPDHHLAPPYQLASPSTNIFDQISFNILSTIIRFFLRPETQSQIQTSTPFSALGASMMVSVKMRWVLGLWKNMIV